MLIYFCEVFLGHIVICAFWNIFVVYFGMTLKLVLTLSLIRAVEGEAFSTTTSDSKYIIIKTTAVATY